MTQIIPNPDPRLVTPILDLSEPLPKKRVSLTLQFAIGFGVGFLILILMIASIELDWPAVFRPLDALGSMVSATFDIWEQQFFMGGFLALCAAFSLAVVIHESAHFLAGRRLGFSLHSLQLGPVCFTFDRGKLKARFQMGSGISGFTAMHVASFVRLHRKLMLFIAAGPASNLICAIIAILLLRSPFSAGFGPYVTAAFRVFALVSVFAFGISILPYSTTSGYYSDGGRLRILLFPNVATRRWYAIIGIGIQRRAGRRARDWNSRWIEAASANWDKSRDAMSGTWMAYAAAYDRKDEPAAAAHLETCLRGINLAQSPFRDIVIAEAGVFQSWFRKDALKAAEWFARVKRPASLPPLLRSRAEVLRRFVQGDFDAAYKEWEKGLLVIAQAKHLTQRERLRHSWLEWKNEMEERRAADAIILDE
jgi:hypothetical protein